MGDFKEKYSAEVNLKSPSMVDGPEENERERFTFPTAVTAILHSSGLFFSTSIAIITPLDL